MLNKMSTLTKILKLFIARGFSLAALAKPRFYRNHNIPWNTNDTTWENSEKS